MNTQPESLRLAHVADHPIPPDWIDMVAAVRELLRLHAENEALQQVYDATHLEIDHLRGVTKMVAPAQPVAWLVYLPSIDTQNVYDSQDDPGYVDDVTNHADAEVTPLYEMAAPKAEVAPAGEYPAITTEFINKHVHPSQAAKLCRADWSGKDESSVETVHPEVIKLLHAYVDADRAMRAKAAPQREVFDEDGFRAWVIRNLPDNTIIGNSTWLAGHLAAWVQRFMLAAPQAAPEAQEQPHD